jgi:hypothetical protein
LITRSPGLIKGFSVDPPITYQATISFGMGQILDNDCQNSYRKKGCVGTASDGLVFHDQQKMLDMLFVCFAQC